MKRLAISEALTAFARRAVAKNEPLRPDHEEAVDHTPGIAVEGGPVRIWNTKGPSFWALLSAILIKTQPRSILELGGGRSTTFLADYAHRYRRTSLTIESSDVWRRKIESDLKCMNVVGKYVEYVPLRKEKPVSWYDPDLFRNAVAGRTFDLLFVDGPSGESRCHENGQAIIRDLARSARIVIVDDTNRDYNLKFFSEVSATYPQECIFAFRYFNLLHICVAPEWRDLVAECFDFLGLDTSGQRREIALSG